MNVNRSNYLQDHSHRQYEYTLMNVPFLVFGWSFKGTTRKYLLSLRTYTRKVPLEFDSSNDSFTQGKLAIPMLVFFNHAVVRMAML